MFTIKTFNRASSLRNIKVRICLARLIEGIMRSSGSPKWVTFTSPNLKDKECFTLLGISFEPGNYLDAMPSFPVFLEYWPGCWGTQEVIWQKSYVLNPKFVDFVQRQEIDDVLKVLNDLLSVGDPKHLHELERMKVEFC